MVPARVFIYPSRQQLELISSHAGRSTAEVVAVVPPGFAGGSHPDVRVMADDEFLRWNESRSGDRWLCCTELGVYFVARERGVAGELNFSTRCLDMLTKLQMSEQLCNAGVSTTPKWRLQNLREVSFPCVVKPNFGFASTLVKRLRSGEELTRYLERFDDLLAGSMVPGYQRAYLGLHPPESLREVLVEPDFSHATFVSVPFWCHEGECRGIFPVLGERCAADETTDFQWMDFRAPARLGAETDAAIRRELEKIASFFELRDGVFEAEMLVVPGTSEVYVLEFSPRITGGSIPELSRLATGVDLQALGICTFLGVDPPPAEQGRGECVVVRTTADQADAAARGRQVLGRFERRFEDTFFVDTIYAVDREPA